MLIVGGLSGHGRTLPTSWPTLADGFSGSFLPENLPNTTSAMKIPNKYIQQGYFTRVNKERIGIQNLALKKAL